MNLFSAWGTRDFGAQADMRRAQIFDLALARSLPSSVCRSKIDLMGELTQRLEALRDGDDSGAVDHVVAMTYAELRDLAHRRLTRASRPTVLDTTSLVHECYL